jgi:DNA helicase-4
VQLRQVAHRHAVPGAIGDFLTELEDGIRAGVIPLRGGQMVTVDVLGRYNFDRDLLPNRTPPHVRVTFRTMHASKGLEADYVVIPNLSAGTHGFPSVIGDDPVLALAMPNPERYAHAEERRLFYVALTRARRGVVLVADERAPSPFVTELLTAGQVRLKQGAGVKPVVVCPSCGEGVLRPRTGRFGLFWGCSTFPRCRHTSKVAPQAEAGGSG